MNFKDFLIESEEYDEEVEEITKEDINELLSVFEDHFNNSEYNDIMENILEYIQENFETEGEEIKEAKQERFDKTPAEVRRDSKKKKNKNQIAQKARSYYKQNKNKIKKVKAKHTKKVKSGKVKVKTHSRFVKIK